MADNTDSVYERYIAAKNKAKLSILSNKLTMTKKIKTLQQSKPKDNSAASKKTCGSCSRTGK